MHFASKRTACLIMLCEYAISEHHHLPMHYEFDGTTPRNIILILNSPRGHRPSPTF